jgi:hypothetical protein
MRHAISKQFIELCGTCLKTIDAYIPVQVRNDLLSESDTGSVDTLFDNVDDYIEDSSEDDGLGEYWNER